MGKYLALHRDSAWVQMDGQSLIILTAECHLFSYSIGSSLALSFALLAQNKWSEYDMALTVSIGWCGKHSVQESINRYVTMNVKRLHRILQQPTGRLYLTTEDLIRLVGLCNRCRYSSSGNVCERHMLTMVRVLECCESFSGALLSNGSLYCLGFFRGNKLCFLQSLC
jgi:hypothetical protein